MTTTDNLYEVPEYQALVLEHDQELRDLITRQAQERLRLAIELRQRRQV